jgi:4-amino-4-deoxy-L-arabinose transferase-like glycosyltransferase
VLTAVLIALLVFVVLYVLRGLDDNRLTSWAWVFNVVSAPKLYIVLTGGIVLSWLALRLPEPGPVSLGVLSFAAASVFWREPEVIVDASRYFTQAKHLGTYGTAYFLREWGVGIDAWTDLPVVPFIYGLGFKVFGESRAVVQAINTAMFSATVVMTARLGSALWSREAGLMAGALLMAMPYLYTQVPLMLVDVPSMFFLMLALLSFVSAVRGGGMARSGVSALVLFLTVFSKFSLWLMLTVIVAAWAVLIVEEGRTAFKRGLAVFALGGAMACTVSYFRYTRLLLRLLFIRYGGPSGSVT